MTHGSDGEVVARGNMNKDIARTTESRQYGGYSWLKIRNPVKKDGFKFMLGLESLLSTIFYKI